MQKIWLVSHYAMPPHLEVRVKTIRYARILLERGYDVLLITASTIHNSDINLIDTKELYVEREYEGLKYVHIRCSFYGGCSIKRIVNMLQFQRRFKTVAKHFSVPDAIVADCNCVNYKGLISFAKKHDIPFITEVRDLWPLSIVEYKNISNGNPIIRYLYSQEKRMYRLSDAIVFSMEGGKDYIVDKGWNKKIDLDKVFYINNGIDTDEQKKQREENILEDTDFTDDCFKVVYAGSIRTANCVDMIVKAARILQENEHIKFLIYGDGDKRAELEKYCVDNKLKNVFFKGGVDKKYIPYICSRASLNIISVKETDVLKYGVSWNKLFDYMNAGRPILSTVAVNYDLIKQNGCGISLTAQTPRNIAEAILQIYNMPKEKYEQMCENAENGVKEYDYSILTDKLEQVIEYAIENHRRKK